MLGGGGQADEGAFAFQDEEDFVFANVVGFGVGAEAVDIELFLAEGTDEAGEHEVGHVGGGEGELDFPDFGLGGIVGVAQSAFRIVEAAGQQVGVRAGGD